MGRPKTKPNRRRVFQPPTGAFSRYLANQVDSEGTKILDRSGKTNNWAYAEEKKDA
jgi:hypothetical protein